MPKKTTDEHNWILGLDVGVASLGWSVVACNAEGRPTQVVRAGSHLFEPATEGSAMDRMRGAEQPKNTARRMARQMRRQTWRRWRRKRKLLKALVEIGLLPEPDSNLNTAEQVEAYLASVDAAIRSAMDSRSFDRFWFSL